MFIGVFFENSAKDFDQSELEKVAENHLDSLTSIRSGFFLNEDLTNLSGMAAKNLADLHATHPTESLSHLWSQVAQDFHSQDYWGFQTQKQKPKQEKKKNEVAGFLWTLFQAAVVMKLIILYFGINAAELDSDGHYIGLAVAIFISFASLLFFAWRKSKTYKD